MAWSVEQKNGEKKSNQKVEELHTGEEKKKTKGNRDLGGGMEILELDFLVSIIEDTGSKDKNDIMMRKMSFNELSRRDQLNQMDSIALKVYSVNPDKFYDKKTQCEAMRELTRRTEGSADV